MKKTLVLLMAITLVMSLTACGNKKQANNDQNPVATSTQETTIQETEKTTEEVTTEAATEKQDDKTDEESVVENNNSSDKEWRQFLKEYEAWVDDYIELVKKYKENPTDMTILSDCTDMLSKTSEWTEKLEKFQNEITDTDDAIEFSKEILRISDKLSSVEI